MRKINNLIFVILLLSSCSIDKQNESFVSNTNETSQVESSTNEETSIELSSTCIESSSEASTSSIEIESKAKNITNYVSEEGGIPLFNIYTDNNDPILNKTDYVSGHLNIVSQPDTKNVLLEDAKMGIRLRGNSTLAPDKKAYRIKFEKKQSLFGLPKAKSWVLLANYFDKSNVRNYLAYLMANKLDNLDFQPSSIMCEVKINNKYRGLYLLCEQIQTGEGRVDIEGKVDSNGYSGFFVESDDEGRLKEEGGVINQTYVKSGNFYFNIKYPEGEDLTHSMVEFIQDTLDGYKNSIYTHKIMNTYIDMGSFIDSYLIQELFKNPDCNNLSLYYYYDPETELIKAGPVWDFDLSLDAVGIDAYVSYKNSRLWANKANEDYATLYTYRKDAIKQRYAEVRDILYSVLDELAIVRQYLETPQQKNVALWELPGDCSAWVAARYNTEYKNLKSVNAHYEYIKTKLQAQLGYMDQEYYN